MDDINDKKIQTSDGVSRRSFLKGVGTGVVSTAVVPGFALAHDAIKDFSEDTEGTFQTTISLTVNGKIQKHKVESRTTLAEVLRDKLELKGTKIGCNSGECGCCTVLKNGETAYSCMTLAVDADGDEITTVEGIAFNGEMSPVQKAFAEHDAYQCGYCTPGQVVAATGLLAKNSDLSLNEVKKRDVRQSLQMCRVPEYFCGCDECRQTDRGRFK